jgi:pimeloyl-[acyl-carrier protein] synthase
LSSHLAIQTKEFLSNPYPVWHRLRAQDPVHWSDGHGAWLLLRYADVVAALKDPRLSSRLAAPIEQQGSAAATSDPFFTSLSAWMLFLDPPEHTRLRLLVNRAFAPRVIERMRDKIVDLVDELLEVVERKRCFDLIADVASPLPTIVTAELLGADRDGCNVFKKWSEDLDAFLGQAVPGSIGAAKQSWREMSDYLQQVVADRKRSPRSDIVSALVTCDDQRGTLTDAEIIATCILLVYGSYETTTHLIGNGMLALLRRPEAFRALRRNPAWIPTAVEEFLRYDCPIRSVSRTALEDLEIGGKVIRRKARVIAVLGAANRDPEQFANPDELDIQRINNRHVALSQGVHFCLGAALARLEAQVVFQRVLERFPELSLATEAFDWHPHGLKALPLTF